MLRDDGSSLTRWWTGARYPVVAVLVSLVALALAHAKNLPCRRLGYPGDRPEFLRGCYSDLSWLYTHRDLVDGVVPFLDRPASGGFEYPVLSGLAAWVPAVLADGDVYRYVDLNVALLAGCGVLVVLFTSLLARPRSWDAVLVAAAPSLVLTAFINWDLLAVALALGALVAWSRNRVVLTGVLIGLGVAAKLYPGLLLLPLLALCLRTGSGRVAVRLVVSSAVAWLVVNVPVAVASPSGWFFFWTFNADRNADLGSIWLGLQMSVALVPEQWVDAGFQISFLLLAAGTAALAVYAPRRPRVAQLVFLVVVAFVLTSKVYSPQYVLWLLPLAVLARPKVADLLVWQAGEVLYFASVWLYLAGTPIPADGIYSHYYPLTIALRVAGLLWLTGWVVRDVLRPADDDVDPAGGVLADAVDVRVPRPFARPRRAGV